MARKPPDEPGMTPDGAARVDERQSQFGGLLNTLATTSARRRGAKGVDNTDVDAAYSSLLSPRERPWIVDVLAEVGLVIGGAAIGYAATLVPGPQTMPGVVILLIGTAMVAGSAILKHVRFS